MAESEGEKKSDELGMAVVDFDMLCATVALQTQGFLSAEKKRVIHGEHEENLDDEDELMVFGAGVQRMWEGDVFDCFGDRRIAIESSCCPCYRFGRNMRRANLGPCFFSERQCFFLLAIASSIAFGVYAGYFRTRIRKLFNIKPSSSFLALDDCFYHQFCPFCTLCQESRTLEMNNVHEGIWHGRGDTICIGNSVEGSKVLTALHKPLAVTAANTPKPCSMERAPDSSDNLCSIDISQAEPLVKPGQ